MTSPGPADVRGANLPLLPKARIIAFPVMILLFPFGSIELPGWCGLQGVDRYLQARASVVLPSIDDPLKDGDDYDDRKSSDAIV